MKLSGNDEVFVCDLLVTYVEDATRTAVQLKELGGKKDWEGIRFTVHKLRSSAGSVGAVATATLCAKIENSLQNTETGDESVFLAVEKLLSLIQDECKVIQNEIAVLQKGSGGLSPEAHSKTDG